MNTHPADSHWGIKPVLFQIGDIEFSTYTFFVILGMIAGLLIYLREARKCHQNNEKSYMIVIGAFIGSTIGAKLLELLLNTDRLASANDLLFFLFSGRTIIGGLIGGTLGVWVTKKLLNIQGRRGNLFAPAIALGVCIGRLGCFFEGCCYGKPSNLPWAVDFGDGIPRHPTQLYESAFMLMMFFVIQFGFKKKAVAPGFLFYFLMIAYFIFRFFIEFIRTERIGWFHLTYFQIITIFVLIYLAITMKRMIVASIHN